MFNKFLHNRQSKRTGGHGIFLSFRITWDLISRKDKLGGKIHILSEQTIDQIAAGEVIENPASVVKELFENAVDAGATHIVVDISGGGLQSIRISDDGCGMSKEDALACLKRHATSKIRCTDDLLALSTMGFRGEAMSSIAAISEMTLTTALKGTLGTNVHVKGGEVIAVEPSARSQGTSIEVRSLFYNVPARKKFQKSQAACSAEITRVATLLALAHPHVGIELIQQKKIVFSLPAAKEGSLISLLEKRSGHLLGTHFQSHMHPLSFTTEGCEIHGLIGDPGITRYNRSGQYLFVNARPVHCLPLAFALRDGYGTRIDTARYPIYVVHAKIEPSLIDVNVHPQKKEIRLKDEDEVKSAMRVAVTKALGSKELPLEMDIQISPFRLEEFSESPLPRTPQVFEEQMFLPLHQEEKIQAIGLFEQYLIVEDKPSGLIWIDLRAAEARLLFERQISHKVTKQALLLPITFSCSTAEGETLLACTNELEELGIELRLIGPCVFLVESIPAFLDEKHIHPLLQALASQVLEEDRKKQCARTIACRSRARTFSLEEGLKIVKELDKIVDALYCPRGKPIFYHMKKDEIEKHFQ